ncbi:MAG: amidohydrolase [Xanthomonadales bacterium]|nr:amidohydrolase [Xanthomonadales bacterium]
MTRCFALFVLLGLAWNSAQAQLASAVESDWAFLESLYLHLHQNPELSFEEVATARRMGDELEAAGFEVTRNYGGHGVVGVMENGPGPVLMIRADMDGLPVREQTGLPYASRAQAPDRDGNPTYVMHACGHDIHMSVFVGTARQLNRRRDDWSGTLIMIAQPAEERSGGAKAMLAQGLFEEFPRPNYNLALHVASDLRAGTVGAVSGYFMANVDSVDLLVQGRGGHGAYPDRSKDPVVLASQIVLALQTIVSREVSPFEPAVVTVGSIHGGTQHNIIPDQVKLQLTLRSYSPEVRNQTISSIRRIARNTALAAGMGEDQLPAVTVLDEYTPAAYNNPQLTERILKVFGDELGADAIVAINAEMVGEDFGRYGAVEPKIPSLMFRLGTVEAGLHQDYINGNASLPSLHSAAFAPDPEPTISTGVRAMTAAALNLLAK